MQMPDYYEGELDIFQVCFVHQAVADELQKWLKSRRWELFRIPDGQDQIPTFGIRPDWLV